jgi:hypothetical protein
MPEVFGGRQDQDEEAPGVSKELNGLLPPVHWGTGEVFGGQEKAIREDSASDAEETEHYTVKRIEEEEPQVVGYLPDGRRIMRMTEKQKKESKPFWEHQKFLKSIENTYQDYRDAIDTNPDEFAKKLEVARRTDLPSHLLDDPEVYREAQKVSGFINVRPVLDGFSPELRAWVSQNDLMRLVHDDLENIKRTEDILKYQNETWNVTQGFQSGLAQTELGMLRYKQVLGNATEEDSARIDYLKEVLAYNSPGNTGILSGMLRGAGETYGQRYDQINRGLKWGSLAGLVTIGTIATGGLGALGGAAAIGGTGALGTGVAVSTVTGGAFAGGMAYGAAESGFTSEAGLFYDELLEMKDEEGRPLDPSVARTAALVYGAGASILEAAQMDKLLAVIPNAKSLLTKEGIKTMLKNKTVREAITTFAKEYSTDLSFETLTEVAQQGFQIITREAAKTQSNMGAGTNFEYANSEEIFSELWETGKSSLLQFSLPLLVKPGMNFAINWNAAKSAQQNTRMFEALNENAKESKLKARLPEAYGAFVEELTKKGPIKEIGIPVDAFVKHFQEREMDPAQIAEELGIGEEYAEALSTGGDLIIPTSTFAEKLAGTEHFDGLKENLRFGKDAMTAREAQKFLKNQLGRFQDELLKTAETEEERKTLEETRATIQQDVKNQILGLGHEAYSKKRAELDSALYAAWAMTEARYRGMDPLEFHKAWGLRIFNGEVTREAVNVQEILAQTMDKDVDLNFRVPVMNAEVETRKTITVNDRRDMTARFELESIVNEDTGFRFTLSTGKHGAEHIAHSAFEEKGESKQALIAAFFHLPEIVQKARRVKTTGDRKATNIDNIGNIGSVKTIRRFLFPMNYDGKTYVLKLTTKEYEMGKVEIDIDDPGSVKLYDQKIAKTVSSTSSASKDLNSRPADTEAITPDTVSLSIGEMAVGVKDSMDVESYLTPQEYEEQTGESYKFEQRQERFINSSEFKAFFKESKVVDENAKPLIVYRGDTDNLESFRTSNEWGHGGSFFSTNESVAGSFAQEGKIYPAYVSLQNPLIINAQGKFHDSIARPDFMPGNGAVDAFEIVNYARNNGYDGVIIKDIQEPGGFGDDIIAFTPEQIKSIDNRGTWNANDANIYQINHYQENQGAQHPLTVEENIRRGSEAMERVLTNHTDALNAMHREDVGDISLFWGATGRGEKDKGGWGVAHLLKRRDAEHEKNFSKPDGLTVARKIVEVIAKGEITKRYAEGVVDGERADIRFDGYEAHIALYKDGIRQTWVLTGYKVTPDVSNGSSGPLDTTLTEPIPRGFSEGAGVIDPSIASEERENKKEIAEAVKKAFDQQNASGRENNQSEPQGSTRFLNSETLIEIFKEGDASTLLHEFGHMFLESRRRLSLMEGIDGRIRQDWTKLLTWLDVADIDFSKDLSETDAGRWHDAQERFARGFEKYLVEGKAPTMELQSAFQNFKCWLLDIYKAIKDIKYQDVDGEWHEFEINDEIRGVMDRMLASEEQIEAEKAAQDIPEMRERLIQGGLSTEEVDAYLKLAENADEKSKQDLFSKLFKELSKERQKRLLELRERRTQDARERLSQEQRYKTEATLSDGEIKLSKHDFVERYGAEALKTINESFFTDDDSGLDLTLAAELLGYEDTDALLEDLQAVNLASLDSVASKMAESDTAKEESLLNDQEGLQRVVKEAIHNEQRLEEILYQIEFVEEQLDPDNGIEFEEVDSGTTHNNTQNSDARQNRKRKGDSKHDSKQKKRDPSWASEKLEALRQKARALIAQKKIDNATDVGTYIKAEDRARKTLQQFLKEADSAVNLKAKREALEKIAYYLNLQAFNYAMVLEAIRAREYIESQIEFANGLKENIGTDEMRKRVGDGASTQLRQMLVRFGFMRGRLWTRAPALGQWAETLESGASVFSNFVLNEGTHYRSYSDMTFAGFEDVTNTLHLIERAGIRERHIFYTGQLKKFDDAKDELLKEKIANYGELPPVDNDPAEGKGRLAKARRLVSKYFSDITAVEFMMRQMDKYKDLGPWWSYIFKPLADAEAAEIKMKREMTSKVQSLFSSLGYKRSELQEKFISRIINPATGKYVAYTKENILTLALNWGTNKNRQRVLGGLFGTVGAKDQAFALEHNVALSDFRIEDLLAHLSDKDWDFVEGVWELFGSYWTEAAKVEKAATGLEIGRESSMSFTTVDGREIKGGYFHIYYNPEKSLTSERHQLEEEAESLIKTPFDRAAVLHGYTKSRDKLVFRQISFELSSIARHLNEVAHDLTHRIPVYDIDRLIHDRELADHLQHVIGHENYLQLSPWLKHIAMPSLTEPHVSQMEKIIQTATTNITAAYLGFKFSVGLRQLAGVGPAADKIGRLNMARAMWLYLANANNWSEIAEEVYEKSSYMSHRAKNFDSNISAAVKNAELGRSVGARGGVQDLMFWWAGETDLFVSIPTWLAAHDKALNDFAEENIDDAALEQKAIDYADMVVRTTQNAGSAKDLALMQRRGPLMRLFTMFYTGVGRLYNLTREEFGKGHGVKDFPRLAAHVLTVYTLPFLIGYLITNRRLKDDGDDEDDENESWLWFLGKGTISEMMRPLVGVKDLFDMVTGTETIDMPTIGDGLRGIKNFVETVNESYQDDEGVDWSNLIRSSIEVSGPLFALPSKQIRASWKGTLKAMEKWDERSRLERLVKTPWDILMGSGPRRGK